MEKADALRNQAPRAKALRALRQWIADGLWQPGETIPSERDIAARLNVGLATVQRAIKVLEDEGQIIKHQGRTRTVARLREDEKRLMSDSVLVIGEWADVQGGVEPFGWGGYVALGAIRAISEAGLHAMVMPPQTFEEARFDRLLASEPMGLIVPEIEPPNTIGQTWARRAREMNLQTVVFGDEQWCRDFDRVAPDHESGAYELTKWLIARGRRHIRQYWTLQVEQFAWARARQRGYIRAIEEAGLQPLDPIVSLDPNYAIDDPRVVFQARSQAAAGAMVPFVLGAGTTDAIMVVSDGSVGTVASGLRLLGKIPNVDIELVGYDAYWDQTEFREWEPAPPLATVDKNNLEAGRQLTTMLLERRAGKLPEERQLRLVGPILKVRDNR